MELHSSVLLQPILHTPNPTKNQTQMLYLRDGKLQTTSCHYIVAFSISQHSLQGNQDADGRTNNQPLRITYIGKFVYLPSVLTSY